MNFRTQVQHVVNQYRAAKRGHSTRAMLLARMAAESAADEARRAWINKRRAESDAELEMISAELDAQWAELQRAIYCGAFL